MHLSHMHDCGTTAAVPKSAAMAALLGRPYMYEIGALPKKRYNLSDPGVHHTKKRLER